VFVGSSCSILTQVSLLSVEANRHQLQENCSSVAKVNPWYLKKR